MNKKTVFSIALIFTLLLAGCGAAASTSAPVVDGYRSNGDLLGNAFDKQAESAEQAVMEPAPGMPADSSAGAGVVVAGSTTTTDERIILMTASRSMLVDDPQKAADSVAAMAARLGGWVVGSSVYQNVYGPQGEKYYSGSVSIRIPAKELSAALKEIEGLAVEVTNRQQTGQDVTMEYTDLQARLTNKEASAEQLRAMIADLRGAGYETDKPEVIIAKVQALSQLSAQLDGLQGEIDSLKGQIKYYNEADAFSLITVDLQPYIPSQPIEVAGWHPEGTAKEAIEDLIRGLQGLADFLIRFGICGIPALLFLALLVTPVVLGVRAIIRRATKKA